MSDAAHRCVRLRVYGRVQGVSFRAWTVQQAARLGLEGWVRNRSDGSVEILAAGPADGVGTLVKVASRGPAAARVDRVEAEEAAPSATEPAPAGFRQRPTV